MKKSLFIALLIVSAAVFAQGPTYYRDSSGRIKTTSTKVGNRTVYRDSSGRITGSSSQSGNRTIYRDSSGRIVGSKQ